MDSGWKSTEEQRKWMLERIERCGSIGYALDIFEAEFGHRPTKNAVYQWAHKAGKHIGAQLPRERNTLAQRRITWKSEPELMAWMHEHDVGQPVANLRADFQEAHGFDITRSQIGVWRMAYSTKSREPRHRVTKRQRPLGSRRTTKGGILVKVRELPEKPGTRDNWEYEHHIAWREAYGEIPEGHQLIFIDKDPTNSSLDNLFCIDKKVIPVANNIGWHDRESLEFAIAQATLKTAIQDTYMREQVCKVCGKRFEPWQRGKKRAPVTCRECLDAGKKWTGEKTPKGEAVCAVCGSAFTKYTNHQVRCQACIAARPKHSAKMHVSIFEHQGVR